jgi:hypothetical protein
MKKLVFLLLASALVYGLGLVSEQGISLPGTSSWDRGPGNAIETAFNNRHVDGWLKHHGKTYR